MNKIKSIKARPRSRINSLRGREILDSRGNPTVEVDLTTGLGIFRASAPSGASKGKYEAVELRDGGERYQGMGVMAAVNNVNKIIAPELKGKDVKNQKEIDKLMVKLDGTKNKSKLGANAICGVSMAVCRAGAVAKNTSLYKHISEVPSSKSQVPSFNLPKPGFNVINGGVHAGNDLDFQEFMIVPQMESFSENLRIGAEIYQTLKKILSKKFGSFTTNLGDEGGFTPPVRSPEQTIGLILEAAKKLNYEKKVKIILDVASSQFFIDGKYKTKIGVFTSEGLTRYYLDLIKKYPIVGLEDPFSEDDWQGWQMLMSNIKGQKSKVLIIGDDLTVTNPERIKMAKEKSLCNGMIVKINQIGTVSETIEAVKLAKSYNWKIMVSHRSGETNDDFIADFAVGLGADFIKSGAPARGERVAKYNRLLKIEEELKNEK